MPRKLTTQEFIERSTSVHGNRYGYGMVEYKGNTTKVKIVCPCGNIFMQIPKDHMRGIGCPVCGESRKTIIEFIKEARQIHGEKYDYSAALYKNMHEKISIICNTCKTTFNQLPNNHLKGRGCPVCGAKKTKTTIQFVKDAKKVHGEKYDYSKSSYVGVFCSVKIYCKNCDQYFYQLPNNHLRGCGCPHCFTKRETETGKILLSMFDRVARQVPIRVSGHKHPLRFDFQVQDNKTFVEYNGKQHYEPVSYFGGKKEFERRQRYDKLKSDWCKQHGWNLIVVPYWIDDIRSFLEQEFSEIPTS